MRTNISEIAIIPEELVSNEIPTKKLKKQKAEYEIKIVWRNVIIFLYIHLAALYGLYCCFRVNPWTIAWFFALGISAILGTSAGAHRLWSHKSYKAKWPLRLILTIFQTLAFQNHIYEWVRDHRMHHKFIDTDADPYNAKRGFFFSHVGWLLVRKHPDVAKRGSTIDCSDLEQDPLVVFQKKWYKYLIPLVCFILPTWIPYWMWGETLWYTWYINICRYCINLNITWMVNSVAHKYGMRPYDKSITPTDDDIIAFMAFGEGWHNYHHAFPWDYRGAELGNYRINVTTAFIKFFALLGWAYDLKTVNADIIKKRALRSGDAN